MVEPRRQHPPRALVHPVHAPREPRPAQRRHAVEHAQGHQQWTAAGNVLAGPVRNPRPADPWAARSRAGAAAAGRAELEGGLAGILAT
ncbi:MAG: hypothetical protein OXH68_19300, partial [Gammaproteobacteria bacterium]|nr:hypothetical protein [Gammaproteobacteria bacterium]